MYDATHPKLAYAKEDGSPAERLSQLHTSLKHFDQWIEKDLVPRDAIPVWITPRGLRSRKEESDEYSDLRFEELVGVLKALEHDIKWQARWSLGHEGSGRFPARIAFSIERRPHSTVP